MKDIHIQSNHRLVRRLSSVFRSGAGPSVTSVTLAILLVSTGSTEASSTLTLLSGLIADQTISETDHQVVVAPGATIKGVVSVQIHNEMPPTAIAPVAATPTWGTPSNSFWQINPWVPSGDSTIMVELPGTLTAPSTQGVYYIVLAMAGTYSSDQIMSGTQPAFAPDWIHGNIVARLPLTDLELAAAKGWIPFTWYSPHGPSTGDVAMTVVKIVVAGPNDGLVAYYPFDGTTKDASGNENNAIAKGTIEFVSSPIGAAARIASGGFIESTSSEVGNFGTNDFAISCWFRSRVGGALVSKRTGCHRGNFVDLRAGRSNELSPPPTPQRLLFETDDGLSSGFVEAPLTLTNGAWHHVLVLREGKTLRAFVDGKLAGQTDSSAIANIGNTTPLRMGISSCTGTDPTPVFVGELDEVRLYNRTLSPSEAHQLWLEGCPTSVLLKAVRPAFFNLTPGVYYQLQISPDLNNWTNHESPIRPLSAELIYTNYWDVGEWGNLFFRLRVNP